MEKNLVTTCAHNFKTITGIWKNKQGECKVLQHQHKVLNAETAKLLINFFTLTGFVYIVLQLVSMGWLLHLYTSTYHITFIHSVINFNFRKCLAELGIASHNTLHQMQLSLICLWKLLSLLSNVGLSCGEFQFGCEQTTGLASMSYYKSITGWL